MTTKKIAIVGRGTAGVYAATHFLKNSSCDIELYFDSNSPPSAVGEGSTLDFPLNLWRNIEFSYLDLESIHGTLKQGIRKIDWGTKNNDFIHTFPPSAAGYHFNAIEFQNKIIEKIKDNPRVKLIDTKISSHDQLDCDHIVDCRGRPSNLDDFVVSDYISINSAHVVQSYWEGARFLYTYCIARPYGWVFAIPLLNRCSVGYLYNNNINTLEEVKEDMKNVLEYLNLSISDDVSNNFSFPNYYRKNNFTKRVCYNGNASFFLEPLEATSMATINRVNQKSFECFFDHKTEEHCNEYYSRFLQEIEVVINLHYFADFKFDTEFWKQAKEKAESCFANLISDKKKRDKLAHMLVKSKHTFEEIRVMKGVDYGTWGYFSFKQNIRELGVREKLNEFIKKYSK